MTKNIIFSNYTQIERGIGVRYKSECTKINKLVLVPNVKKKCRFKVDGNTKSFDGNPYDIKFEFLSSEMELSTSDWSLGKGEVALTNITTKKAGNFTITVRVNGEITNNIEVISKKTKDSFSKKDTDRLVEEIEYIVPFVEAKTAPEYDENYCMQAAERGLSRLLNNTIDFYSVQRGSHTQISKIRFSGLTAIDRGNKIQKMGYVKTNRSFNGYIINHSDRKLINNSSNNVEAKNNYKTVMYSIVNAPNSVKKDFYNQFILELDDNYTFHVYYLSITGGFHTLLLIIDFRDPCNAKYKIYDQHGITRSTGQLDDIADGFIKQTSWTFANTCLNRYYTKKTTYWDSTETRLWKIQRK